MAKESSIRIVNAFGVGKYRCPLLHVTEGVLRITVNGVDYDGCPKCFALWLTVTYPTALL